MIIELGHVMKKLYLTPRRKYTLIVLVISLPFLYILSYCALLPIGENVLNKKYMFGDKYLPKYFYLLYEPIECLRFHSDIFWKLTEKGYRYFNGKKFPVERIYSTGKRRDIYFKNGIKVYERKYSFDSNGCDSAFTRWTDNGSKSYEQYPVNESNSKAIWYDANNKTIASGILRRTGLWNLMIYPIESSTEPTDDFIGYPFSGAFIVKSALNGHIIATYSDSKLISAQKLDGEKVKIDIIMGRIISYSPMGNFITIGNLDNQDKVLQSLGKPDSEYNLGSKTVLVYKDFHKNNSELELIFFNSKLIRAAFKENSAITWLFENGGATPSE
jgi:hypothetical protein